MTVAPLPLDIPFHLQEPLSCRRCKHSGWYKKDTQFERLICMRHRYEISCTFERHETGECGPSALFWKERGI